ncbi:hypothetical protein [Burkholderia sp. PU8-34]
MSIAEYLGGVLGTLRAIVRASLICGVDGLLPVRCEAGRNASVIAMKYCPPPFSGIRSKNMASTGRRSVA